MDGPITIHGSVWQNMPAVCLACLYTPDGDLLTQAVVSAITRRTFDLDDDEPETELEETVVDETDAVFDDLQTDDVRWGNTDDVGFNFADVVPATVLPNTGHTYRVEYVIDLTDGNRIAAVFELQTQRLFTTFA